MVAGFEAAAMFIATMVSDQQHQVGLGAVVGWALLVAAAAVTMWATRCIIAATVLWVLEFSLAVAYDALWQLGAYPTTLLQQPLRILTYILPVAFIATIPTAVLVEDLNPAWALVGVGAAALTTAAAQLLWRLGIRNYSSATS